MNASHFKIGHRPWNKGLTNITTLIRPNQTSFKKGHIPWHKGTKGLLTSNRKGKFKRNKYFERNGVGIIILTLSDGNIRETQIDCEDKKVLDFGRWTFNRGYAVCKYNGTSTMLHNYIKEFKPVQNKSIIDHINKNSLDNTKSNLRIVTPLLNSWNTKDWSHNTSGIRGVGFHKPSNKWLAHMQFNGKPIHLGIFEHKEDAILKRQIAECIIEEILRGEV